MSMPLSQLARLLRKEGERQIFWVAGREAQSEEHYKAIERYGDHLIQQGKLIERTIRGDTTTTLKDLLQHYGSQ